jgi:hypothetical protein
LISIGVFWAEFLPMRLARILQIGAAAGAFGLLFMLAFGMPSRAESGSSMMPVGEIERQLIGKRLDWKSLDGSLDVYGQITFHKDGRVVMSTNLPGLAADEGRWWFDANQLCTRWAEAREGEAKCYNLIDQGGGRYMTTGGNLFEIGGDPMV